ncbi:MAG TPA: response regulator, partial [Umezawaea sp.]|nr:response regulator [Umezawaea sp.]
MRVLLVEDDDRVAEALVPALTRRGFTVDRQATGRGTLDRLLGVDVVLLDLGLPDVDGVTLCRSIRAASDVAIIVVSARGEIDDRILGLHAGADDYLVKPY